MIIFFNVSIWVNPIRRNSQLNRIHCIAPVFLFLFIFLQWVHLAKNRIFSMYHSSTSFVNQLICLTTYRLVPLFPPLRLRLYFSPSRLSFDVFIIPDVYLFLSTYPTCIISKIVSSKPPFIQTYIQCNLYCYILFNCQTIRYFFCLRQKSHSWRRVNKLALVHAVQYYFLYFI